jgi:hypothetical protein
MTAVEWLIDELKDNGIDYLDLAYEIIEKAKELEKQQIIDAFQYKFLHPYVENEPEQYYNQTYKPSNQQ